MSEVATMPKPAVLTGGPGGGKTTARNFLDEKLSDFGINVTFVPEVATLLINAGLNPAKMTQEQVFQFQSLLFSTQLMFEESTFKLAMDIKSGDRRLMICDRGLMDAKAYMPASMFADLLAVNHMTETEACDQRYGAIFHLVTAADGKPEFYTTENNTARSETPEQAILADRRTRDAWIGHPHLRVIDNSTLFDAKLKRILNEFRKYLGIPVAIETERKFLVKNGFLAQNIPVPFRKIQIEQAYLDSNDGGEMRLRRRNREDCTSVHYETHKMPTESVMSRVETEHQITAQEYMYKLRFARPDCDVIRKNRNCFLYKNQYFELDFLLEPQRHLGLTLLEIELTEENDKVEIPDWLGSVEEVTGDSRYSNFALARR